MPEEKPTLIEQWLPRVIGALAFVGAMLLASLFFGCSIDGIQYHGHKGWDAIVYLIGIGVIVVFLSWRADKAKERREKGDGS